MAEFATKIETSESIGEKFAAKLGVNQPSPLDMVSRSDFASDEAYLDAVVIAQMKQNNPEYQAVRRKLQAEYQERQEKEQREAQAKRYQEIRSAVQLSQQDVREIDAAAADMARRDLAAGRIFASDLGATIERYAKDLTEKRKDTTAGNQLFNAILRGNR